MTLPTLLSPSLTARLQALRSLIQRHHHRHAPETPRNSLHETSLPARLLNVFLRTWDLGFTAFGGPPVHFQILHGRFVGVGEGREGERWVDEQTYQELFAICQGTPGPGSTKMIFCLALLHAGFVPALFVFLVWSLPGAIGMYALSLGVRHMSEILPPAVYALLSGLNASTVGIIALAAVQLAEKAIKDKLTRILVIMGAVAGLCYNALWFFPTLMAIGGIAAVVWDGWLGQRWRKLRARVRGRRSVRGDEAGRDGVDDGVALEDGVEMASGRALQRRSKATADVQTPREMDSERLSSPSSNDAAAPPAENAYHTIKIRAGIALLILFFTSFIAVLVTRGALTTPPLPFSLFTNLYLAGTIIFGGGPVVIPLLRSYVVDPGWVSSRDFLLGLAIIQAFPGPNFNFAVYLGALALQNSSLHSIFGAFLAYVAIFAPGILIAVALQSFWRVLRKHKAVIDLLRGVNATAVGLVFTAVYRLWEIGYLTPEASRGQSLAIEPWWVVVATVTYAGTAWFGVPPAVAILVGGGLGVAWWGAVGR
ncbi:putative chromate ion transporter [Aulographum hederae CBS 113979]|uniref:Putative chromate ion transporter n=1 Tax=Aulographum hederae CBS 113979 TaxID=1176131 RepID=A0A6G1GND1_9PEZI|nr:putative chromate ion transporter [Aulographum hederae CBS 113979]